MVIEASKEINGRHSFSKNDVSTPTDPGDFANFDKITPKTVEVL